MRYQLVFALSVVSSTIFAAAPSPGGATDVVDPLQVIYVPGVVCEDKGVCFTQLSAGMFERNCLFSTFSAQQYFDTLLSGDRTRVDLLVDRLIEELVDVCKETLVEDCTGVCLNARMDLLIMALFAYGPDHHERAKKINMLTMGLPLVKGDKKGEKILLGKICGHIQAIRNSVSCVKQAANHLDQGLRRSAWG